MGYPRASKSMGSVEDRTMTSRKKISQEVGNRKNERKRFSQMNDYKFKLLKETKKPKYGNGQDEAWGEKVYI